MALYIEFALRNLKETEWNRVEAGIVVMDGRCENESVPALVSLTAFS